MLNFIIDSIVKIYYNFRLLNLNCDILDYLTRYSTIFNEIFENVYDIYFDVADMKFLNASFGN